MPELEKPLLPRETPWQKIRTDPHPTRTMPRLPHSNYKLMEP